MWKWTQPCSGFELGLWCTFPYDSNHYITNTLHIHFWTLKAVALSPDADTDFYLVTGVLQSDISALFMFTLCLDYVLQMSVDQIKVNDFILKVGDDWIYWRKKNDADAADDLVLIANIPAQAWLATTWEQINESPCFIKKSSSSPAFPKLRNQLIRSDNHHLIVLLTRLSLALSHSLSLSHSIHPYRPSLLVFLLNCILRQGRAVVDMFLLVNQLLLVPVYAYMEQWVLPCISSSVGHVLFVLLGWFERWEVSGITTVVSRSVASKNA